jgi:hypothetical protein
MWESRSRAPRVRVEDPYLQLDRALSRSLHHPETDRLRDPFAFGASAPAAVTGPARAQTVAPLPAPPPEPPRPVLTSIIWDNDPRATLRYADRDYSVRVNSLFADFRVKSITSTQVVLERNGESLVLTLRRKGE